MSVTKWTDFDASKLVFSGVEKNRKGGKVVYVGLPDPATGERQRVTIQTPVVALPFGVSVFQEAGTGDQSFSIDMSFRGHDTDPAMADFLGRMRALDQVLLDTAVANSKAWFGKTMSRDVISEFFRKLVKDPSNPRYAPVMKVKLPMVNGESRAAIFDENRQPVTLDYVVKGCSVKMLLEIDRLWFVNKNFGVTWRLCQALVVSRPHRLEGYAFLDDDAPSADAPSADAPPPPPAESADALAAAIADEAGGGGAAGMEL